MRAGEAGGGFCPAHYFKTTTPTVKPISARGRYYSPSVKGAEFESSEGCGPSTCLGVSERSGRRWAGREAEVVCAVLFNFLWPAEDSAAVRLEVRRLVSARGGWWDP